MHQLCSWKKKKKKTWTLRKENTLVLCTNRPFFTFAPGAVIYNFFFYFSLPKDGKVEIKFIKHGSSSPWKKNNYNPTLSKV